MPIDTATIDRIVAGVLTQLGGDDVARGEVTTEARRHGESSVERRASSVVEIAERVVTAAVLEEIAGDAAEIVVDAKAVVTPAARDIAKSRGFTIRRRTANSPARKTLDTQHSALNPLLIIVHHTDPIARLWDDLRSTWRREFLGCPDDAAQLAIAELARGGTSQVVIVAEQVHRAACLANRHERAKAVAIRDAADVQAIRTQLRANVWCLSPQNKSWFELRRLFQAFDSGH